MTSHLKPRGTTARRSALAIALTAGLVLTSCASDEKASPGSGKPTTPQRGKDSGGGDGTTGTGGSSDIGTGTPKVQARDVIRLDSPTMLIPRPGDPDHLYAADRIGKVIRLTKATDGGLRSAKTLLDITGDTTVDAERGLLGLAFDASGDVIYVSSTDPDGNTRLASYDIAKDGAIDEKSQDVILTQEQPYPNHNGGNVVLGPDGKLWFGFGDGGAGDDPENRAQDPDTVLGKIVRFSPGDKPEIVVSGLRNPWRFSFDTDGSLWIGDVGQNKWEEISHLPADDIDGANLGWSGLEGTHANMPEPERQAKDPVPPVFEYSHDGGNCSVTGGFPYRGTAIPALRGAYLFADYCAGDIRAVRLTADGRFDRELDLQINVENPQAFGADQDGEPYVLSGSGPIVRIVPA